MLSLKVGGPGSALEPLVTLLLSFYPCKRQSGFGAGLRQGRRSQGVCCDFRFMCINCTESRLLRGFSSGVISSAFFFSLPSRFVHLLFVQVPSPLKSRTVSISFEEAKDVPSSSVHFLPGLFREFKFFVLCCFFLMKFVRSCRLAFGGGSNSSLLSLFLKRSLFI